ncbi:isopentenyl phosphate kinase [Streptomyces polygonati]|uniref:Isopentenyl phosphate kinase n=1 Tax=Streptomyces polygonati TaxID=1617087 RepID=A0ABV8HLX9_9ACTN
MITLVKIGGSVLTDKQRPLFFQDAYAHRVAADIRMSRTVPVIVHGTGSWAKAIGRHYYIDGGWTRDLTGFQMTALRIRRLQEALAAVLRDEGVVCSPIQANAVFHRTDGVLDFYDTEPIRRLVEAGVSPLLCGDVLVEGPSKFRVVSSDAIAVTVARRMPVSACVFATDVDGVWDPTGRIMPEVTQPDLAVSDSDRRDVTGGMSAKIAAALSIARTGARTTIVNGRVRGRVRDALAGRSVIGTRVVGRSPRSEGRGGPGAPGSDRPAAPELGAPEFSADRVL